MKCPCARLGTEQSGSSVGTHPLFSSASSCTDTALPSSAALPCSVTSLCSPWKAPTALRIWGVYAWYWDRKKGKEGSWSCSFAQHEGCGSALGRAGTLIPNPHLCSARLGLQPAPRSRCCQALCVWEGRRLLSTSKPGCQEGQACPTGPHVPGGGGRVQALGASQNPRKGQKAHKSHPWPLSILELHSTTGWDAKAREAAREKPSFAGSHWVGDK